MRPFSSLYIALCLAAPASAMEGRDPATHLTPDTVENHDVALKVATPDAVATFPKEDLEQEARIASRLRHPNIVAVYNADWIQGRFVIATGASPTVPPIPGLDEVPYLTNETIFDNAERIQHLIVLGGGPIGCELGQAHRMLGSHVTIFDTGDLLSKEDPEAASVLLKRSRNPAGMSRRTPPGML